MDPIANMLSAINNAGERRYPELRLPYSKLALGVAKILSKEGYLRGSSEVTEKGKKHLIIQLKYAGKKNVLKGARRISKPGKRVYIKSRDLPRVKGNLGLAIVSTSAGLMTNIEARRKGLGGEILLEVW